MPLSFKLVGVGLLLILAGAWSGQRHLRLLIWGKRAEGSLTDAWEHSGLRRGGWSVQLEYEFKDDRGEWVTGWDTVSTSWRAPEDLKVKVVFLPGKSDINQLAEKSGWASYLAFLLGVALTLLGGWYFFRESVADAHRETERTIERAEKRTLTGRIKRTLEE